MEILSFTPENKLIEQVRNVTMLTDKTIYPYKDAIIRIEDISIDDFMPTQLYILRNHIKFQEQLRQELLNKYHDTLRLFGGLMLKSAGVEIGMMPPVVEDDYEMGPSLLDGTHRVWLARKLGMKSLSVLHISNVCPGTPMISTPNQWHEVIEYDNLPADKSQKKRYRDLPGKKYDYYRDFSNITGIGKDPRSEMTVNATAAY